MKAGYKDILNKLSEKPLWYDANGVPRYEKFNPELCSSIYAKEVVLLRIGCQACKEEFLVSVYNDGYMEEDLLGKVERLGFNGIGYGDPPRHGGSMGNTSGCLAGDTMTSETIEIVEFWVKGIAGIGDWNKVIPKIKLEKVDKNTVDFPLKEE